MTEEAPLRTEVLAETSNYLVWRAEEPDGEMTHHLELGQVTLHFFVPAIGYLKTMRRFVGPVRACYHGRSFLAEEAHAAP